jgi:hypothetical protein
MRWTVTESRKRCCPSRKMARWPLQHNFLQLVPPQSSMKSDISIEESDVGIVSIKMRSQTFEDILMRLHGFLNDNLKSVPFGETTRGRHK